MRKLVLLGILALIATVTGLTSPPPTEAAGGGGNCVTYCAPVNSCGYICCYQTCCGNRCIDLDCAPPPPCPGDN